MKISTKGWGYLHGQEYKSANEIVDGLVDRVARGGGLLLSLCPLPDGTLNPPQVKVLTEMGDFLTPNGQAIFNTRPWKIHAEGDDAKLNVQGGKHSVWKINNCDATDIRFTRSKDLKSLYVITLGYPEGGKLLVKSLGEKIRISSKGVQSVSSVKTGRPVEWKRSAAGMEIKLPAELGSNEIAYAFKVEVKGSLDMDAQRYLNGIGICIF